MFESATVTVARPTTAAAGVCAPGHVGELTQYLPFELVDDGLSEAKRFNAGALDPQTIRDELLSAALQSGLGRREAERTTSPDCLPLLNPPDLQRRRTARPVGTRLQR